MRCTKNSKPIEQALARNGADGPSKSHNLPETIGPIIIPKPWIVRKNPHTVPFSLSGIKCDSIVSHVGRMQE
jgi:hypothetical protein